jgi:hypothetical protein
MKDDFIGFYQKNDRFERTPKCKKCGTEMRYNAELTHDPTFKGNGVCWYYCPKCNINFPLKEK